MELWSYFKFKRTNVRGLGINVSGDGDHKVAAWYHSWQFLTKTLVVTLKLLYCMLTVFSLFLSFRHGGSGFWKATYIKTKNIHY